MDLNYVRLGYLAFMSDYANVRGVARPSAGGTCSVIFVAEEWDYRFRYTIKF